MVPGFKPTTFWTRVSSHSHHTRTPGQVIIITGRRQSPRYDRWPNRPSEETREHLDSLFAASVTRKKTPKVYKSCPKMISLESERFWHLYKNCLWMWEIWANYLLPKAIKSCPKSNKSPNLVTLFAAEDKSHRYTYTKWTFKIFTS